MVRANTSDVLNSTNSRILPLRALPLATWSVLPSASYAVQLVDIHSRRNSFDAQLRSTSDIFLADGEEEPISLIAASIAT